MAEHARRAVPIVNRWDTPGHLADKGTTASRCILASLSAGVVLKGPSSRTREHGKKKGASAHGTTHLPTCSGVGEYFRPPFASQPRTAAHPSPKAFLCWRRGDGQTRRGSDSVSLRPVRIRAGCRPRRSRRASNDISENVKIFAVSRTHRVAYPSKNAFHAPPFPFVIFF